MSLQNAQKKEYYNNTCGRNKLRNNNVIRNKRCIAGKEGEDMCIYYM